MLDFNDPNLLEQLTGEAPVALAGPNGDAKTLLNTFCQRYCKKPISKADVEYTTSKVGALFQAVVKLNCLDGIEFAGETASTPKDAEKNAAHQALQNYASEMATLDATTKPGAKKRKAGDMLTAVAATPGMPMPVAVQNSRMALNTGLMRILHRALAKEDLQYSTVPVEGGFQCTISCPALPGEWGGFAWAGEVASQKKAAEENAATQALEALRADPSMNQAMETPPVKKTNTNWKGGGKGKGGGDKGKGKGKGGGWGGKGGGKGKGKGGGWGGKGGGMPWGGCGSWPAAWM